MAIIMNETTKAIMRKMFAGEITEEEGFRQLDEAGCTRITALLPDPRAESDYESDDEE
jgi:hypothetical protein